jgi:hypothetical protein
MPTEARLSVGKRHFTKAGSFVLFDQDGELSGNTANPDPDAAFSPRAASGYQTARPTCRCATGACRAG